LLGKALDPEFQGGIVVAKDGIYYVLLQSFACETCAVMICLDNVAFGNSAFESHDAGTNGDPRFKTLQGQHFDFHG
jgi:hypothetical protein